MLTNLPRPHRHSDAVYALPTTMAEGSLLIAPAWRRLASFDDTARSVDWFVPERVSLPAVPRHSYVYELRHVLDAGFFFPLPPESPFATRRQVFAYGEDALAQASVKPARKQIARTKRPRRRKLSAVGLVPAFFAERLSRKFTKKHPRRKRRRVVTRRLWAARRPLPGWRAHALRTRSLTKAPQPLDPSTPPLTSGGEKAFSGLYFIPQTRFKPGFRAQWRLLRYDYARTLGIRAVRQARITRYVAALRALRGFAFLRLLSMTAGFVLRQASLSWATPLGCSLRAATQHTSETGWLLNNSPLTNLFLQTYPGDVFTLASAVKFWDTRPKHAFWAQSNRLRHENLLGAMAQRATTAAPWFLEVDELTESVGVLAAPRRISDLDPSLWHAFPFLTHRMLNWKYRY